MANGFKFVGGKFVQRSNEEQARLDRLQAAQAAREPARKKRTPRAQEPFVMLTLSHVERLLPLSRVCWPLFAILLFESFRARGEPFELPIHQLSAVKGLSPRNLPRALAQLEVADLIRIRRKGPPQPPLISVPIRPILAE